MLIINEVSRFTGWVFQEQMLRWSLICRVFIRANICGKKMKEVKFLWGKSQTTIQVNNGTVQKALEQKWPMRVVSCWATMAEPLSARTTDQWIWVPRKNMHLGKSALYNWDKRHLERPTNSWHESFLEKVQALYLHVYLIRISLYL